MSLLVFFIFLLSGRLWVWLLQTSGLTAPLWQLHPKLTELGGCDLCLGFWVYLLLALFAPSPFGIWPDWIEIPTLAAVSSFLMHLIRLGWLNKFGTVILE